MYNVSTVTCCTLSTQQPTYLVNLQNCSDIYIGPLDHPFPNQLCVPKTKLNIGKRDFFVAAPTLW